MIQFGLCAVAACLLAAPPTEPLILDAALHHLRSAETREWTEFPEVAEARRLDIEFTGEANPGEWTLELRQQDVRRAWKVSLNGAKLGELTQHEGDQFLRFPLPAGAIRDGGNQLAIECTAKPTDPADDIRVGEIRLWRGPPATIDDCRLEVRVADADSGDGLPARITVTTPDGALVPLSATSAAETAVRTGCVYTAAGSAAIALAPGRYVVHAGRGFEYSLARAEVELRRGETQPLALSIRRVVPTEGYIACDTHTHTRTHSGHGDARVEERMITLAAEGIELPIATDHNVQIDHEPFARAAGVREYFTPVVGNEVTTGQGHFNIFPVAAGATPPDHTLPSWAATFDEIFASPGVQVVILNHARDLHRGVRPFDPLRHNSVVGVNLEDWPMRFNAMEVLNSGATQTDTLQLTHDWMGLLCAGHRVAPVGSSDSHDVDRYIVGQGRTYIRGDDSSPARIDPVAAANNLAQGRVLVSYGLIAELRVNGAAESGDLVSDSDGVTATVRVLGPEWVRPRQLILYANGQPVESIELTAPAPAAPGVWYEATWQLPAAAHDQFLAAVAVGDGIPDAYWRTAKPYQPTSPHWESHTFGCSGAVYIDRDGDGRWTSPRELAERLLGEGAQELSVVLTRLAGRDAAVAAQAAHLYRIRWGDLESPAATTSLRAADPAVRRGFEQYLAAWRENQAAQFAGIKP